MNIDNIKPISIYLLISISAFRCADSGSLSGEQRKEPKKDRPATENTNINGSDASQPQVVTGAYLACVPDAAPETRFGESAFGCGIYDSKTQAKIDLSQHTFQLTTLDAAGQILPSRTANAPSNSPYQRYLYTSAETHKISGRLIGSGNIPVFSSEIRPIVVNSLSDGFRLKADYQPAEIDAWCALVTLQPDNTTSSQSLFTKGSACGAQYLCTHKYPTSLVTCTVGGVSAAVGSVVGIFNGQSSNFGGNAGVCLDPSIPGHALYASRCK